VNDWAEIRRLSRLEHQSGREIARALGVSRHTVARALAAVDPPVYHREPVGSMVDSFVPELTRLLRVNPGLKSTVLAERVGFNNGVSTSVFRARVALLKQQLGVVDPPAWLVSRSSRHRNRL
jgi:hypothetical protein